MPIKTDAFFTAGNWEKDIIFGGHFKQTSAFLSCQSFDDNLQICLLNWPNMSIDFFQIFY